VTNKLDQAGAEILRYYYDAASRLTARWSAAKGYTYYTNDALGNLTSINYPSSLDVRLQYDELNRLTKMVDGAGTNNYAYTAGGLLCTEGGLFSSDTVTNGYLSRKRVSLGPRPVRYRGAGRGAKTHCVRRVRRNHSAAPPLSHGVKQPTGTWTNGFGWDAGGRLTNVTSRAGTPTPGLSAFPPQ
jgi:YD repeat-containing protein